MIRRRARGEHRQPGAPWTSVVARRPAAALAVLTLLGTLGIGSRAAAVWTDDVASDRPAERAAHLTADSGPAPGLLWPGGSVTGSLLVSNRTGQPRLVTDVRFSPVSTSGCTSTGAVLAPTLTAPLEVPARGSTTLEWTAFMDGTGDSACQGAALTSRVLLDGEPAGTVSITAGTLERPPAPTGGLTTATRAAVHWSASTVAHPGWVVERAPVGTDGWQPACGSSPARPVRALACTDAGLTAGTAYAYRVTLRTGRWRATSRPSEPVTTQARPTR